MAFELKMGFEPPANQISKFDEHEFVDEFLSETWIFFEDATLFQISNLYPVNGLFNF